MNNLTKSFAIAGLLSTGILLSSGGMRAASAQATAAPADTIPTSARARVLPRQKLSGPRFGITTFTGDVAEQRRSIGESAFMSQFGWQFETQIVSTDTGHQALLEWVVLLGGFEQDMRNLSVSWLAGYRLPNGFELGVGPNFGLQLDQGGGTTSSMVTAVGSSIPFGDIYVPINVAVAWAEGGPRITTLLGWIIR